MSVKSIRHPTFILFFIKASILTGIEVKDVESANRAAMVLIEKGCKCVVITLGKHGCVFVEHGKDPRHIPVPVNNVNVIDTTVRSRHR